MTLINFGSDLSIDFIESEQFATSVSEFVTTTLSAILKSKGGAITIDGLDGVGKTTIAKEIAEQFGWNHINLDNYLCNSRGFYFNALRFDEIKSSIDRNRTNLIEGCLASKVASALNINSTYKIYIVELARMRCDPSHEWLQGNTKTLLEPGLLPDAIISQEEEILKKWWNLPPPYGGGGIEDFALSDLRKEIIHYHHDFQPHRSADLIIKRIRLI